MVAPREIETKSDVGGNGCPRVDNLQVNFDLEFASAVIACQLL